MREMIPKKIGKIDFDPTFDRGPGHEESIGDVCFQF